jgi:hypothetical protein
MESEWLSLVAGVIDRERERLNAFSLEYRRGAGGEEIHKAERTLGFELPAELRSLLMEFNGIHEYATTRNGEEIRVGSILWDLPSIVEWHLSQTVPQGSSLFCFGNSVLGNCFGYRMEGGRPVDNEICQINHESEAPDQGMIHRASSLKEFVAAALLESLWY